MLKMKNLLSNPLNGGYVHAHCDLMCGVYDPAQARIEAQSVYNSIKIYQSMKEESMKQRAVLIKEERAELVKEHLWVLWTDYFKPEHDDILPNGLNGLHDLFWRATKAAGDAKKSTNIKVAEELISLVDEIGYVFEKTKEGYEYERVVKNLEIQAK